MAENQNLVSLAILSSFDELSDRLLFQEFLNVKFNEINNFYTDGVIPEG